MSIRPQLLLAALVGAALLLPAAAQAKTAPQLYVSLGDSYAAGYQPAPIGYSDAGFAYQVPTFAKKRGYKLKLVNYGCGGATTTSLVAQKGCAGGQGPKSTAYPKTTQLAAATAFIKKNRANVKLITVSISGNDVTKCAKGALADVGTCVNGALSGISTNLSKTVKALRKAGGSKVKIVGITYPDVILGGWVQGGGAKALAEPSVAVFKTLLNPALKKQYESVGGSFVDVTTATGGYIPLTQTTTLAPYGVIPQAVANVCTLTWYCEKQDIHAKKSGYGVIAELIAKDLPKLKR